MAARSASYSEYDGGDAGANEKSRNMFAVWCARLLQYSECVLADCDGMGDMWEPESRSSNEVASAPGCGRRSV
jgi:hypothetical protein